MNDEFHHPYLDKPLRSEIEAMGEKQQPNGLEWELVKALAELLREHECLLLASSSHNSSRRSIWHDKAIDALVRYKRERAP